ncbi:MAG: response regulator [SAR202 cluster bacterium]|jgi:DNA-binding response OmpR family regulator|nr:hypothetical protein [Chloroflexota bacterium]MDP6420515.1 response regulator [SAR202 cluster bacterium]HAL48581.1 hypothetical protein [Dehalococcoidia bacterium]MDP6664011.1 response regulator [SAR202 cluster bacterium]MDP6799180.1 response regulator [SAR202 cluster bacterium]|tara:strand:+ start:11586 stop:11969 length:384 start_codon:yes stop_codon:yes gene_type:complete
MDSNHKILIVEDQSSLRTLARLWLELEGYEVVLASDGVEGLRRFAESAPDLIVTDMDMPRMNGVEFSRSVRITSSIPIVMWSANPNRSNLTIESRPLIDDYADKTGDSRDLVARVAKLLPVRAKVTA